jgi:hypothetical protein
MLSFALASFITLLCLYPPSLAYGEVVATATLSNFSIPRRSTLVIPDRSLSQFDIRDRGHHKRHHRLRGKRHSTTTHQHHGSRLTNAQRLARGLPFNRPRTAGRDLTGALSTLFSDHLQPSIAKRHTTSSLPPYVSTSVRAISNLLLFH